MNKLELKHLAPYLPYGLKVRHEKIDFTIIQVDFTEDVVYGASYLDIDDGYYPYNLKGIKPILKPLFQWDLNDEKRMLDNFERLFEEHYDVYGLIEKGLAIDFYTIK